MSDRNSGRNADGTFATGNSGRPRGTRHRFTLACEALLEGEAEALTRKAIDMALGGDTTALRICIERITPPRKDTPIQFELPPIDSAQDAGAAAKAILRAVAEGDITPAEGASVMALVDQFRRTMELGEIEARLAALETAK